MTTRVFVSPAARGDLAKAAEWYEQREPGSSIPLELFDEFDEMVSLIGERPEAFPRFDDDVRRAVLKQFPYGIYYTIEPDRVVVLYFIAMAQEQGPDTW
jgi:hypothetical protein